MKLITRDTDYAVRALCCIAAKGGQTVSARDLACKLGIPRAFLRKILQTLNSKRLLRSSKGKGGGFILAVSTDDITIFQLIEIFQGPFELDEHVFKGKLCPRMKKCSLKKKIDRVEGHVTRELASITIASLL